MTVSAPTDAIAHWCKLLDGFQTAPSKFYATVEEALKRREVPNIELSRVDWKESGVFSVKREYLRVSRGSYVFDICGAPFGTGFFVSSWLVRPIPIPWPLTVLFSLIAFSVIFGLFTGILGLMGVILFVLLFPLMLWGFVQIMNEKAAEGWDDSIVAIPILGAIHEQIFRPTTYFRIDTMLMFQESVQAAVLEAIDQITGTSGVRMLSEFERKPMLTALTRGAE